MTRDQTLAHLRAADEVAREAAGHRHHPFGCVLVDSDDRILMRQSNIDTVRHAETEPPPIARLDKSGQLSAVA
jgi:tRNA(Arg) A34 adenosine deaminase TadA